MPSVKRRASLRQDEIPRMLGPRLYSVTTVLGLTTLLALFLISFIEQRDPYHCHSLLRDGRWPPRSPARDPDLDFEKWEPSSCRMIEYSRDAFHDCLGGRRVVFSGDSTIRQIYWAAAARLDHMKAHVALLDVFVDDSKHENLRFEAEGVTLEFIWDPWLNSSSLHSELTKFRAQETFADVGAIKSQNEESAALVILGSPGLWAARHGGDEYMDIFRRGIESIRVHLGSTLGDTLFSPTKDLRRNYDQAPNQILLAPVQVPWYDSLSHDRATTITPERVDKMNQYLAGLPEQEQSHMLWTYNKMTSDDVSTYEINGIHVVDRVAERMIDIALNARCNAAKGHQIPHEITCCIKYPEKNVLQVALYLSSAVALIWVFLSAFRKEHKSGLVGGLHARSSEVQVAACLIVIVIVYCATADRGHKFLKLNRHYDANSFVGSCLLFLGVSLLSKRNSRRSTSFAPAQGPKARFELDAQNDQGFLSRDQSNEWKGWMQVLILIYHYNHASQTLWVYKLIRLLVSGYIFLSGYGHTLYFLKKEDYSMRRVGAVIFRLNLLSALLPYMMGTDYNFYYFAPVITFWYLVVFVTLRVFKKYNQDPILLFAKIIVAAIITSCLIIMPQPLTILSTACRRFCYMHWDAEEARFRLMLDRYTVFFGMSLASIVHRMSYLRARKYIPGWQQSTISRSDRPSLIDPVLSVIVFPDALTRPIKPLACAFSALFILFFTVITQTQIHDKTQYNIAHPYMSWIPILSFLILRNSLKVLRNTYLALPAALGEISLETYVLQYHIWLGGDATAKLRLGIWGRYGSPTWFAGPGRFFEFILITGVFFCLSGCARHATDTLAKWLFHANQHSIRNHSSESGSFIESKERSSEDENKRPAFSFDGPYKTSLSQRSHSTEVSRLGSLKQILAGDVRARVLVMLAMLWVGNLLYL